MDLATALRDTRWYFTPAKAHDALARVETPGNLLQAGDAATCAEILVRYAPNMGPTGIETLRRILLDAAPVNRRAWCEKQTDTHYITHCLSGALPPDILTEFRKHFCMVYVSIAESSQVKIMRTAHGGWMPYLRRSLLPYLTDPQQKCVHYWVRS